MRLSQLGFDGDRPQPRSSYIGRSQVVWSARLVNYLPVWAGPKEQRVSGLPGFLSSSSYQLQGNQVSNNPKLSGQSPGSLFAKLGAKVHGLREVLTVRPGSC